MVSFPHTTPLLGCVRDNYNDDMTVFSNVPLLSKVSNFFVTFFSANMAVVIAMLLNQEGICLLRPLPPIRCL